MRASRDRMPQEMRTARTLVRRAVAEDLPRIEAWPGYPPQYDGLNMSARPTGPSDKPPWWRRIDHADRCHYSVVLPRTGDVIGVHAFVAIDWERGVAGNMGVRIRPDLCDQGYGTETLRPLLAEVLRCGIRTVRLDVAATNPRAIRFYEKCGLRVVSEWWREHTGGPVALSDPDWPFEPRHFRQEGDRWMVRFYWMEISASNDVACR